MAALVLTKPLSRAAFVQARLLFQLALVVVVVAAGSGVCGLMTWLLFGDLPVAPFLGAIGLWLVLAMFLLAAMTLLSVLFSSPGGASGVGLGVYFVVGLLSMWGTAARFSPVGLASASSELLAGKHPAIAAPVVTALLASALLVALATWVFQRKDL